MNAVGEAISVPGRFPVEAVPSLLYLPSWFPGAGFKKYATDARAFLESNIDMLYDTAVSGLVSIVTMGSICAETAPTECWRGQRLVCFAPPRQCGLGRLGRRR